MRACFAILWLIAGAGSVNSVTLLGSKTELPEADILIPLKPITIKSSLSDLVTVGAPVVPHAQYYLTRPDGATFKLNITHPTIRLDPEHLRSNEYNSISVKQYKNIKVIEPVARYTKFDLSPDSYGDVSDFEDHAKRFGSNDLVIGPLLAHDHGNWVLSVFYVDDNEALVEMYQVITIEISEYVPPKPRFPVYKKGDTFEFSFAYAIPDLETCELRAPKSTFDRFYERDLYIDMARCGYVIKNLTAEDRGLWRIVGVGRIVYATQVFLDVK